MPLSSSRRRRQRVVLPAPEGADTTKTEPRALRVVSRAMASPPRRLVMLEGSVPSRVSGSLQILDLFPDLLDLGLDPQRRLADRQRLRLGREGVGLAVHLLHQEIERLSDRPLRPI